MATVSADLIRSYFVAGAKPTSAQFSDFVDMALIIDSSGARSDGQQYALKWVSAKAQYIPVAVTSGGGGGVSNLDDLADVIITSPAQNDFLVYDGASWVNATADAARNQINAQTSSPILSALAALNSTQGFLVQTGAATFARRSLAAGANIVITDTVGSAGNPSIAVSANLNDIRNVSAGSPTNGQVLTWQNASSQWVAASGGSSSLAGLTDVTITSAENTGFLVLVSGDNKWINASAQQARNLLALQPSAANLSALAALDGTQGFLVQTGTATFVRRGLTAGAGITITDTVGSGASPSIGLTTLYQASSVNLSALAALNNTQGFLVQTGAATFVRRDLTAGAGITITDTVGSGANPTIALTTLYQASSVILSSLAALNNTQGFLVQTGASTFVRRSLAVGGGLAIVDSVGSGANPTISLNAELSGLSVLGAQGFVTRTAAGTYANRSLTAGTGLTITDTVGSAGNPTIAMTTLYQASSVILSSLAGLANTQGFLVQTGAATFVQRGLTAGSGITITDTVGSGANPTIALTTLFQASAVVLSGLAALNNTQGFVVQTGASTFTQRGLTAGSNITITDTVGSGANPSIGWSSPVGNFLEKESAIGNIVNTVSASRVNGDYQRFTVTTASANFFLPALPTSGNVFQFIGEFIQDGTGNRQLIWKVDGGGTVIWAGQVSSLSTAANSLDIASWIATVSGYRGVLNRSFS